MKKIFFALLFASILGATAQNVDYLWSPVMDFKFKNERVQEVLSYNDKALFILRKGGDIPAWYQVEKYNPNLSLAYQTPMKLKGKGPRDFTGYISTLVCNDVAIGLFYHWEDASSTYNVIACKIQDNGDLGDEVFLGKYKAEKFGKAPDYKFISSPDGSKIAAIGLLPFEKESIEKWHVLIYETATFKKVLDKTLECLVPRERFEINDLMLSNTGSLQVFKMWDIKKEGKFSTVVTVKPDGSVKKTDLDLGGKAISFRKVFVNASGHASVVGFINPDDKDWKRISGHFYFSVNDQGVVQNNALESLGEMVLKHVFSGLTKGKIEKEDQPLKDFEFVDMIENENGELSLFIEYFSQTSKSAGTDPTALISTYDRTHKDMLLIHLDKSGKKLWAQKLDKKQEYSTTQSDKRWGGAIPFMNNNQTYFLWNNIQFPEIPGKLAVATQGWYDAAKQKHFVYEEFGNRAHFPTCLSGINENGELLFTDQPIPNAMPLVGMYQKAIYNVTFSSSVFARYKNSVVVIMEMPAGITSGAVKYQLCKFTVN